MIVPSSSENQNQSSPTKNGNTEEAVPAVSTMSTESTLPTPKEEVKEVDKTQESKDIQAKSANTSPEKKI
jgi:hypothetical protein